MKDSKDQLTVLPTIKLDEDQVGKFSFSTSWLYSSDDDHYLYPYGEPSNSSDYSLWQRCDHEWVNVGFNHIKLVCKKCDTEKEEAAKNDY